MEIARLWVKRDEGVFANLKKRSAWSGDHRRWPSATRGGGESSSEQEKREAPVVTFDGALVS